MPGVPWEGDEYQERFDALARSGTDVHGEAGFVLSLGPTTVLDAGCGTGRVGIELDRRGVTVVGVGCGASMLATARRLGPAVRWVEAGMTAVDLGEQFDVVVMAGNVPLFTPPGTQAALVAGGARPLRPGGPPGLRVPLGGGVEVPQGGAHVAPHPPAPGSAGPDMD